ncbi:MAG: hypothetical protein IPK78_18030 [Rhodospirillales bacterium]|nr:hypothetical protein [Rhodospirillales bacterium]
MPAEAAPAHPAAPARGRPATSAIGSATRASRRERSPLRPRPAAVERDEALERACLAIGRLDTALRGHPLQAAWRWRSGLDAVARQAAADGRWIDRWQLAALLAGARLRLPEAEILADRGAAWGAARHALALWGWSVRPDAAQRDAITAAAATLPRSGAALPGAADAVWAWLDAGGGRPPLRAALAQYWRRRGLLPIAVPLLSGARALHAGVPWQADAWTPRFYQGLAEEAEAGLDPLRTMDTGWRAARAAVAGRRRDCHAAAAVDLLAAAPLLGASALARALGVSVRTATALLDDLAALGVAVEVTRRQKAPAVGPRRPGAAARRDRGAAAAAARAWPRPAAARR